LFQSHKGLVTSVRLKASLPVLCLGAQVIYLQDSLILTLIATKSTTLTRKILYLIILCTQNLQLEARKELKSPFKA